MLITERSLERIFLLMPTPAVSGTVFLSLTSTLLSFTAYFEALYKETSLNPFDNCVPVSRNGRVLDCPVCLFFLLGNLVRLWRVFTC